MSFSISGTRAYFDTKVLLIDSGLVFLDDVSGDDAIGSAYPEKYYKLWFGDVENLLGDNSYLDNIPLTLEIYEPRARDITASFDTLLTKALDIKNAIIDPVDSKNNANFSEITAEGINIVPFDSDDKTMRMRLNFIIRFDYCLI